MYLLTQCSNIKVLQGRMPKIFKQGVTFFADKRRICRITSYNILEAFGQSVRKAGGKPKNG